MPDKLRIVHVGSVEYRKAADSLIKAISMLPQELLSRIEVYFVGRLHEPDYVRTLRHAAQALGNIHFLGELPRREVLALMKNSDIFVCTSRQETGPIVVFEAMALGRAIITTKVGAAAEIITHTVDGYIINIDDTAALTSALAQLLDNPELRSQLGVAARKTFERQLSIEDYVSKLAGIIDEVTRSMSGQLHSSGGIL
jgi:glycosyltransferase involved in cell wall biosynthesis